MVKLPKSDELNITTVEEAAHVIKLLLLKIQEIEHHEPIRDQGLVEEIIHLRQETREGFDSLGNRFISLENKVDQNTLAIRSLEKMTEANTNAIQAGFSNIGALLQEISNKLDG